jgi:phosphoglucosamine mutase
MQIRFGTDGLRGKANTELTPEVALALGSASAAVLGEHDDAGVGVRGRRDLGRPRDHPAG